MLGPLKIVQILILKYLSIRFWCTSINDSLVNKGTLLLFNQFQEKVFVSLGNTPADFKLLTRLLGPDNRNIEFLHIQTNARVELRGKGSLKLSTEPLHFLVKWVCLGLVSHWMRKGKVTKIALSQRVHYHKDCLITKIALSQRVHTLQKARDDKTCDVFEFINQSVHSNFK